MAWTLRPVVEENTLIRIDLVECSCSEMKCGEVGYSTKEEAEDNYGAYWDSKWEKYKGWKKVYKEYVDPIKATLYMNELLKEKDKLIRNLEKEVHKLADVNERQRIAREEAENAYHTSMYGRW